MPVIRVALLAAGVVALAVLWGGPLPQMTASRFSAHMLLHMGVVAIAAPLVALAVAGGRFDPVRHWPAALNPVAASVFELVMVWGWHAPALHQSARHDAATLMVEQASFFAAGLWLWLAACGGDRADTSRAWIGMAALLFTSIHMTLLGALFALAPRAVYVVDAPAAVADQHLGGSLMLLVGGTSYLAGGLWLACRGLRETGRIATPGVAEPRA